MFSRPLVIVLCLGVAVLQATRGNWFEVAGLLGLGGGLVVLRLAQTGRMNSYAITMIAGVAVLLLFVVLPLLRG